MLHKLQSHFQSYTPKQLPTWSLYLSNLNIQKDQLLQRFVNADGMETRGFRLLRQMLDYVEIDYLRNQPNDFTRYINWFFPMKNVANRLFYPAETGRAYRKMFHQKKMIATSEYICPTLNVDHLSILPLGQTWESWINIQPVHLWYNDSLEYSLNLVQEQVVYKYNEPSYSLIFVDPITLMFKYYKYLTSDLPESEKTPHEFIHKHVFPFFFNDLQCSWILNQLKLCVEYTDKDLPIEIRSSDRQYGYLGGRYVDAMESIKDALLDIKDGNLRVNSFLSAAVLPTGSIIDRIQYTFKYLDIEQLQQFTYVRLLRDMPILDLIVQLHQWRADTATYKSLARDMLVILRRYQSNKPWSRLYDSVIRSHISDWVSSTIEKLS